MQHIKALTEAYELANTIYDCTVSPIWGPSIDNLLSETKAKVSQLPEALQMTIYTYVEQRIDEYYKPNEDGISPADMVMWKTYN